MLWMVKNMTKNKRPMSKSKRIGWAALIAKVSFVVVIVLIYWLWLFAVTPAATEDNTYTRQEMIVDVEVHLDTNRGTDKLVIHTDKNSYLLDLQSSSDEYAKKFASVLRSTDSKMTLTIWEHFPKSLLNPPIKQFLQKKQVVDIRCGEDVYWDVSDHNAYLKRERTAGIIAGGIFSSIILGLTGFFGWLLRP